MSAMVTHRRDLWKLLELVPGDLAELGVAEGYFSAEMLSWPIHRDVYLVDRWQCVHDQKGDASNSQQWHNDNFRAAQSRVARYGNRAIFLQGETAMMARLIPDKSLALVYVDADHSYAAVMADIRAWIPKLRLGGYMAFHDYQNPSYGVQRAVKEFCASQYFQIHDLPEDKPEDAGAYFRLC